MEENFTNEEIPNDQNFDLVIGGNRFESQDPYMKKRIDGMEIVDQWAWMQCEVIGKKTYKHLPDEFKDSYKWVDVANSLFTKYCEIDKNKLQAEKNPKGYIYVCIVREASKLKQDEYDRKDTAGTHQNLDHINNVVKEYDDNNNVISVDLPTEDVESQIISEDSSAEGLIKAHVLREKIEDLCKLLDEKFDDQDLVATVIRLINSEKVKNIEHQNEWLLDEINELKERLKKNGYGDSLAKGTPKMHGVMKIIRYLFEQGITSKEDIIQYFKDNNRYCNLNSIGVCIHMVREEKGISCEPRKKTELMLAGEKIDSLVEEGIYEFNIIKTILKKCRIYVKPSAAYTAYKKSMKKRGIPLKGATKNKEEDKTEKVENDG